MVALFVAILGDSVVLHIRRGDRDNLGVIFLYFGLKNICCGPSLILLHSEWPKLYGVFAVLSAIGLKPS